MTLERAVELEKAKIKTYDKESTFLSQYGFYDRAREQKQIADDHRQYMEWFKQLSDCKAIYDKAKKTLSEGRNDTSEDSAENKKAYAIVQALREVFDV